MEYWAIDKNFDQFYPFLFFKIICIHENIKTSDYNTFKLLQTGLCFYIFKNVYSLKDQEGIKLVIFFCQFFVC